MTLTANAEIRRRSDALDALLRLLRIFGFIGFLGGLAALSAMWAFGPQPETAAQWRFLISHVRAVFFTCSFTGIVILLVTGLATWWRHRHELKGQRWFRLMVALLIVVIPASHLSARTLTKRLESAMDAGDVAAVASLWNQLGYAYIISLSLLLLIAAIAIVKPRFGQV